MLATSVAGISITLYSQYGAEGVFASSLVSLGTGGLALFAKTKHRTEILRTMIFAFIGFWLGLAFRPIGVYGSLVAHATPIALGIILTTAFGSLAFREDNNENIGAG